MRGISSLATLTDGVGCFNCYQGRMLPYPNATCKPLCHPQLHAPHPSSDIVHERCCSAGDQLLRKDMSQDQREQLTALLDSVYSHFLTSIAAAKGKSQQEVRSQAMLHLHCLQHLL